MLPKFMNKTLVDPDDLLKTPLKPPEGIHFPHAVWLRQ